MIYVIDDDVSMCRSIERLLKSHGFAVACFSSAVEFLQQGKTTKSDCLLVDIHMPKMNGLQLKERMNQLHIDTPVIFMTAFDSEAMRVHARETGAAGFFRKPFESQVLIDIIQFATLG